MSRFVQSERKALADLLAALGPDAPTLCTGWETRDLAAHIVLRERRPDCQEQCNEDYQQLLHEPALHGMPN